jgi:hypothetical protein
MTHIPRMTIPQLTALVEAVMALVTAIAPNLSKVVAASNQMTSKFQAGDAPVSDLIRPDIDFLLDFLRTYTELVATDIPRLLDKMRLAGDFLSSTPDTSAELHARAQVAELYRMLRKELGDD